MPDRPELTQLLPVVRRRPLGRTITARAVLAACAVAVVSVLVTALIAIPIAVRGAERQALDSLDQQAQVAAKLLRPRLSSGRTGDEERLIGQLRTEEIDAYLIRAGQPDRPGLPSQVVARIAAGHDVSMRRPVGGRPSIVVGRALPGGNGVVLVSPRATGLWREVLGIIWLPLLAGLAAGVGAGVLIARRMVRPIRNAATAAARLRAGDRRVRVPVEPPQETADLAYALNDLAAALATSEGRQREFLLSVSHELRTPLTAIRGYAEALADGVVAAEGAQRAGQTMLAEAEHLDRLVSDLLALARLEAADFPLAPVRIDLAALVRDAAEAWGGRCAAAGVVLRVELPAGEVPVFTDPGRIRQVVDGLLENALRILPAGAPVVLAAGPAPAGAVLEVRDGGPGLTDDDLAVAFERGALRQRYEGVRKVGSGLGLALAAGLVRRLGGTIHAGHAPEGGARFTVMLPPYEPRTQA
ncbi:HAMP domain-containing sensor histidine kinase [Phytohabitans sp. ZYX-F-186]|uniref:histidine kinase n=1 Tax=Phytohabitans maris TaxID=3071409 RepID=A0ABU0ZY51_9ACTN|nr:HAMP domain-containing sensor histidine kinase [Phytohabitans sp. ZYX-F-186]MDQ7911462.1 HAMP domain-containing sensor histidine kinase [Phytohabitans sp. ZYX-F-186]